MAPDNNSFRHKADRYLELKISCFSKSEAAQLYSCKSRDCCRGLRSTEEDLENNLSWWVAGAGHTEAELGTQQLLLQQLHYEILGAVLCARHWNQGNQRLMSAVLLAQDEACGRAHFLHSVVGAVFRRIWTTAYFIQLPATLYSQSRLALSSPHSCTADGPKACLSTAWVHFQIPKRSPFLNPTPNTTST